MIFIDRTRIDEFEKKCVIALFLDFYEDYILEQYVAEYNIIVRNSNNITYNIFLFNSPKNNIESCIVYQQRQNGFMEDIEYVTLSDGFQIEFAKYRDNPFEYVKNNFWIRNWEKKYSLLFNNDVSELSGEYKYLYKYKMNPKDIDMLQMIEDYAYLCYEQSETSAHKYFDDDFDIHTNDIIADIGCAEALITLDYIDIIEHAYLFECNENRIEALKKTFEPWKNKVTIVNKFVGEKDINDVISLDTFFKDKQIDLIKMDIEGNEIKALLGAQNLIKGDKPLKFAVCAYHEHDDEDNITKSPGKLFTGCSEIPYFNTGVIRAVKL